MALTPNNQIEAILSGEDIPVSSRQLAFLKEAIQNGGSGETYETVAEIAVGTMTEGSLGLLVYEAEDLVSIPSGANYYFNSENYPLTEISEGAFVYGIDTEEGTVTDPAFGIWVDGSVTIIRSTKDLSNTTVRILKKASAPSGGSELPEVSASDNGKILKVVDGAWDKAEQSKEFEFTAAPDGQGGYTVTAGDDVTYVAILNAMASSPLVFAIVSVPALNNTVIAQFNAKSSVGGNGVVAASIVGYFNSAYCIMELYMRSDGTSGVNVVPIPSQS